MELPDCFPYPSKKNQIPSLFRPPQIYFIRNASPTLSPPHPHRAFGNILASRIRLNPPVNISSFICACHGRYSVHKLEPADKGTAPASPRAAGRYSLCAMLLSLRTWLLVGLLHLPDPQLAYGAKRHCEASRRAIQMRHFLLWVAQVLYSGEEKWVGRLCLLSATVCTQGKLLEASDCERVGDDRGSVQSFTY